MTKEDVLRWYDKMIQRSEERVEEMRSELDNTLSYLGEMNFKKYQLLQESKTQKI